VRPTLAVQYGVLLIGVIAVSWSAILIREADAPALIIGSYRMVLAGIPVGAFALIRQRRAPAPVRGSIGALVLSAAFLAAHFGFWIESLKHTSVMTSVVLVAAQPLYVALVAPLVLGEPVERAVWVAIGIATAGALLMTSEDLGEGLGTIAGDVYAFLGGVAAAGYFIVGRLVLVRPRMTWVGYVGIVYPLTAVLLVAAALIAGDAFTGYTMRTYVILGLTALVPQLIGHTAINWSLAYLSAVIVSIMILLEPLITTGLAIPILDEWPTPIELAGGLLVLAGVYLAVRPREEERLAVEIAAAD
jgi:drug/metabolite transporter (DMT)-like permease